MGLKNCEKNVWRSAWTLKLEGKDEQRTEEVVQQPRYSDGDEWGACDELDTEETLNRTETERKERPSEAGNQEVESESSSSKKL